MKRNILRTVFAACITSVLLIQACDPLEPSTLSENFFRIATVVYKEGRVGFYTDYDHELFFPANFRDTTDAVSAGLSDGLHVKVWFTLDAIGSLDNNTITLNGFKKIDNTRLADQKPSDTLNHYYYFAKYNLTHDILSKDDSYTDYLYPSVWAEGHIVNIAPTYFVPDASDKAEFRVYPYNMSNDTLFLRLYSYIPTCDISINPDYTQTLLSLDMSSIRDNAANPSEQELRDTILARIDRLNTGRIVVRIATPDTLRALNSNSKDNRYVQPAPNRSTEPITIPIDF